MISTVPCVPSIRTRCPVSMRRVASGIDTMPGSPYSRAYSRAEQCDVYIAAGTQLTIDPTAENAEYALETGATLVVIGECPTAFDAETDYRLRDDPASTLARLRDTLAIMG
jgi:NAD-dependent SIR2 family protein deacetylase